MNVAAIIGYITAIGTVIGSGYGIWATRPKSKAETQFIYAQASDIVFDQLQEEVKRLHDGLIEERIKTGVLEVKLKDYDKQFACMSEKIDQLQVQVDKCGEEKGLLLRQLQEMGANIREEDKEILKKEENNE